MTNAQHRPTDLLKTSKLHTVEDYQFEPIKGYPMLHWKGKRPFNSTQYYPAQRKEVHGEEVDGWLNKIFWGDNLQVMSHLLKEYRGKVTLCYIDPPFDSQADYKKKIKLRGIQLFNDVNSFEEKQYADIWINDEYLQFIYERLILIKELLSEEGVIFLHCDWHKSHYLRCILDEIFGKDNFINEVIWQKCNSKNYTSKSLSNVHDSIFLYSKNRNYRFNEIFEELSNEYIESAYKYIENNRRYRLLPLHAPGIRNGATGRKWNGLKPLEGNHWRFSPETLDEMDARGLIEISSSGVPSYKKYLDESKGIRIGTIWLDAKQLPSSENKNYPTQKPESIIEKIVDIGSNYGDIVFDCFMGSGTTQAVAMKLGRKFIGADINLGAVQITTKRLLGVAQELTEQQQQGRLEVESEESTTYYTGFEVHNVNHYDIFRNPVQAKELLIEALEINPLERNSLFDGEKDGRMVKIMPVNRIATRADLSELTTGFDYKVFEKRYSEHPNKAVEKVTLVCMGHEPDLAAQLQKAVEPFILDVEVVDILRDKSNLEFKRDSEADIKTENGFLVINNFYPMNLLQKLSIQKERVNDWREMVESVMIDWNYDGAVLEPEEIDISHKDELVKGKYKIPEHAGTIKVKITDLLSESYEEVVQHG